MMVISGVIIISGKDGSFPVSHPIPVMLGQLKIRRKSNVLIIATSCQGYASEAADGGFSIK